MSSSDEDTKHDKPPADADPGEPGAEGGRGGSFDTPPGLPDSDDDSALGDTDQHSGANA